MRILVGIDDTDNKDTRGTGYQARCIGSLIQSKGLGDVNGISRHQLYVHPSIPYTSQNSSACLDVETDSFEQVRNLVVDYLSENGAPGSDVGVCIQAFDKVSSALESWGRTAKEEILNLEMAYALAERENLFVIGLTGEKIGIIGAMAGVGLRKWGYDGRFIWLKGKELRDLQGEYTVETLINNTGIEVVGQIDGNNLDHNEIVDVGGWVRPVINNGKSKLLVRKVDYENKWEAVTKDIIRSIS